MSASSSKQRHILVVNDDPAILELFEELLSEDGYRVTLDKFERETSELLDIVRELQPDLVLLDFIIGGERKGWQLLQVIKMDRSTRDIPVLVCTAAVKQVTELSTHLDELKVHVVIKPFDIDVLLTIIGKIWQADGSPTPGLDTLGSEVRDEKGNR